jgi:hypothetical protein
MLYSEAILLVITYQELIFHISKNQDNILQTTILINKQRF